MVFLIYLIGRLEDWLTERTSKPAGRGFFRAVKACPPLFAIVAGIGFGCWLTWLFHVPDPMLQILIRGVGVICLGFYGWLEALFVIKAWTGGRSEFCDRCWNEIDQQP